MSRATATTPVPVGLAPGTAARLLADAVSRPAVSRALWRKAVSREARTEAARLEAAAADFASLAAQARRGAAALRAWADRGGGKGAGRD